jgi:UDP-glucose 4-epimerase
VAPEVFGFDPRLQFTHEDDVTNALMYSATHDVPGIYNVAGDGTVTWSEVCRILGRPRVPLPPVLTNPAAAPLRAVRVLDLPPEMLSLLRYGRGVDNSRFKQTGFRYKHSTAGTVDEFARSLRLERAVGSSRPAYRYERDVETFFRHSPAVVRDRA